MPDLNRPETWTLVGMLIVAVLAFMRGMVMPGITHDRIVKHLQDEHQRHVDRLEEEVSLWRQLAMRSVQLSELSVDIVGKVKTSAQAPQPPHRR